MTLIVRHQHLHVANELVSVLKVRRDALPHAKEAYGWSGGRPLSRRGLQQWHRDDVRAEHCEDVRELVRHSGGRDPLSTLLTRSVHCITMTLQ